MCTICNSPNRSLADSMLLERVPLRKIADNLGYSMTSLWSHKQHAFSTSSLSRAASTTESHVEGIEQISRDLKGLKRKAHKLWLDGKKITNPIESAKIKHLALMDMTRVSEIELRAAPKVTETQKAEAGFDIDQVAEVLKDIPGVTEALGKLKGPTNGQRKLKGSYPVSQDAGLEEEVPEEHEADGEQ
jgi:hypothetical protein